MEARIKARVASLTVALKKNYVVAETVSDSGKLSPTMRPVSLQYISVSLSIHKCNRLWRRYQHIQTQLRNIQSFEKSIHRPFSHHSLYKSMPNASASRKKHKLNIKNMRIAIFLLLFFVLVLKQ